MNTIAFTIVPSTHAPTHGEVSIAIDGCDLRAFVADAERASAAAEGHPALAGKYSGLAADGHVLPPSAHFLGTVQSPHLQYDEKVQVLGCECGEPGCWPLLCRISLSADEVAWSDFEQPHRSDRWSYAGFGPFTFSRRQFESALGALVPGPDAQAVQPSRPSSRDPSPPR